VAIIQNQKPVTWEAPGGV